MIEKLAKPILDQLEKMDLSKEASGWAQIPQIHLVKPDEEEPLIIDGVPIDDAFIEKLEAYIQEEIEMLEKNTILH